MYRMLKRVIIWCLCGATIFLKGAQEPVAATQQAGANVTINKPQKSTAASAVPRIIDNQVQQQTQVQAAVATPAKKEEVLAPAVNGTNQPPSKTESTPVVQQAVTPEQSAATVLPVAPQPPEEQHKQAPQAKQIPVLEEIKGIDTVDLEEPRGNWLFKRIWWERAELKFEKIHTLVGQIVESRIEFFRQRTRIDKELLDPFYLEIGLGKGEIQTVVNRLLTDLESEREKQGSLTERERDLLYIVQEEKKNIEQVGHYIEVISKIDVELEQAISKLLEQITRVRGYERDAWKHFKDIARVLSDTKARELYYRMDVAWSNIEEVNEYIKEDFTNYFEKLVTLLKTHIDNIKGSVEGLKIRGIDLQERAHAKSSPAVTKKDDASDEQDSDETDSEEDEPQGFSDRVIGAISGGWDTLISIVTWPYTKLFGSADDHQDEPAEESQEENDDEQEQSG